jgi:exonuclease SbcC
MSKFLYFQDGHCKGKNSINRIGNYFEDWLIKFDELLSIAKENKVEAIIDGGDILHSSEPSYRILDEIADRIEKNKIPIYCLFGNHSERYHSIEHSRYTGLAHLFKRSKYFNYLTSFEAFGRNDPIFTITPYEYTHSIEEDLKKSGIIEISKNSDKWWKIAIVHAFVTPKPFLPQVQHICCDDIKTNYDIVLVAHYHNQWEKQVGNTLFKDIGCFGRNSITEKDIKPSCLLIDTDKREIKQIFLKSAKKAEEVFDLSKVEELKSKKNDIDTFIKSIEDAQFQEMSIKDTIKYIAKEKNISKEPVDLIIDKIKELE